MTFFYSLIAIALTICGLAIVAYKWGYSKKSESILETELNHAKIAKEVRSGKPLDDKWLRPRD